MYYSKKAALVILDGWGHGQIPQVSAIAQANTPFVDGLYRHYPNAELTTFGEAVGLPEGQMGNSEVGHLNIGAGRVVYQMLLRINNAVRDGLLAKNEVLQNTVAYAQQNHKPIHLMGLVSDGGVHSHLNHLKALCDYFAPFNVPIYIHVFTDGRDTDPNGGINYVSDLQKHLAGRKNQQIASITGRYYAMDRDKRWERIKLAYDAMVNGFGNYFENPIDAIRQSYENEVTDEFILPIVLTKPDGEKPVAAIKPDDAVLCINFRTDRCRQITTALTQRAFPDFDMQPLPLHYVTMTEYDDSFKNVKVIFENDNLVQTMGEVLSELGKKQIRIAETEKYPHVTFFFSGGREEAFEGEKRIMIPSPKVATYDLQPEMSAHDVTAAILPEIEKQSADFICLNFANTDMVGHTGVFSAAVKAAETVDACLEKIVKAGLENDYAFIIIADHGNADLMLNPDGSVHTAHTTNPVPVFLVGKNTNGIKLKNGKLADIAPTILSMMQLPLPEQMTGDLLIVEKA